MAFDQQHADTLTELNTLKRHLADLLETMHGILENGPWAAIPDPALRDLVSQHVADAVAAMADEVGADDAGAAARELRRGSRGGLPLSLEEVAPRCA